MSDPTAGALLRRVLSAAGVGAAYGRPLAGVPVHPVQDPAVAVLLAHAHRTVHGRGAVAHLGGGAVIVPGASPEGGPAPALPAAELQVAEAGHLAGVAPVLARALDGPGLSLRLDLDLSRRAPVGPLDLPGPSEDWVDDAEDVLRAVGAGVTVVVLAGPGVVREQAVGGLRALAAAGRLGVVNTWGAKGVFHWRSRHHWATVGLQERDLELAGLGAAGLLLVTGIDEREAPRRLWAGRPHHIVPPGALGPLSERWPAGGSFAELPALRQGLAAATQAGWAAVTLPLMPTRVTQHYAWVLGGGGLVAADAGTAGYWVARTFATTRLGSASVPAAPVSGWAAACALCARITSPLRPVLAVVDDPSAATTQVVLDAAAALGVRVGVEAWVPDGPALAPEEHLTRLEQLAGGGGVGSVRTDPRQLDEMVAVAGPVRAWTDDAAGPVA